MVFPWVEEYLQQPHDSQKKLIDNTIEWMIKDNPLKAATNMENLNASLATYIGNIIFHSIKYMQIRPLGYCSKRLLQ